MPKIIERMKKNGEWGEFFPLWLTPFAYNETIAQEWFPLEKKTVIEFGMRWQEQLPGTFGKQTVSWDTISDSIENIDTISEKIFTCITCGKSFKILENEFSFYKKQGIPLPRQCVDCRHYARKKRINPQTLWPRACMKCGTSIQTTYAPERPEKVLCENCYLAAVY
ncbi:hypothetical protein HYW82_00410 [Candidatus Peregrinibacteria bacterium]|nr:hypothetical protein [Candidatus Peregrinibacteria bacterium]